MFLKAWQWKKIFLSGGLLFVAAQGTAHLPEVRQRIFPEGLLQEKLLQSKKECEYVSKELNFAFNTPALQEAIKSLDGVYFQKNKRLLVRKSLVNAMAKLNYLVPALKRLGQSSMPEGPQEYKMSLVQTGVQFLYWRCEEQREVLQDLISKLNRTQGKVQKSPPADPNEKGEVTKKNAACIF